MRTDGNLYHSLILLILYRKILVAGVVGFEPTISCTKNSCPTARPHPNREVLITLDLGPVQERKGKKLQLESARETGWKMAVSVQGFVGPDAPEPRLGSPAPVTRG